MDTDDSTKKENSEESWTGTLRYMEHLRYGPTADERGVSALVDTFNGFVIVQLLATLMKGMAPAEREDYVEKLRAGWKTSLRRHVNKQVMAHEAVLKDAPDAEHLQNFIGDGEDMRLACNTGIKQAEVQVEEMLEQLVERLAEKE